MMSRFGVRVLSLYKWANEKDNLLTDTRKAFALPPRAKTEYGSWTKRKDDSRYLGKGCRKSAECLVREFPYMACDRIIIGGDKPLLNEYRLFSGWGR